MWACLQRLRRKTPQERKRELEAGFDKSDQMINESIKTQQQLYATKQAEYRIAIRQLIAAGHNSDGSGDTVDGNNTSDVSSSNNRRMLELKGLMAEIQQLDAFYASLLEDRVKNNNDRIVMLQSEGAQELQTHRVKFLGKMAAVDPDKVDDDKENADEIMAAASEAVDKSRPALMTEATVVSIDQIVAKDLAAAARGNSPSSLHLHHQHQQHRQFGRREDEENKDDDRYNVYGYSSPSPPRKKKIPDPPPTTTSIRSSNGQYSRVLNV